MIYKEQEKNRIEPYSSIRQVSLPQRSSWGAASARCPWRSRSLSGPATTTTHGRLCCHWPAGNAPHEPGNKKLLIVWRCGWQGVKTSIKNRISHSPKLTLQTKLSMLYTLKVRTGHFHTLSIARTLWYACSLVICSIWSKSCRILSCSSLSFSLAAIWP